MHIMVSERFIVITVDSHISQHLSGGKSSYIPDCSAGLGSVRGKKFILSPKIKGRVLEICVLNASLYWHCFLLYPQDVFLAKPIFYRYFRNFLTTIHSAEMTEVYIDTFVKLPDIIIVIILIIIISSSSTFMRRIFSCIPESKYVFRVCNVAAFLY